MRAVDRINAKYGHGSLYLASAGTAEVYWEYTTRLADLPLAML